MTKDSRMGKLLTGSVIVAIPASGYDHSIVISTERWAFKLRGLHDARLAMILGDRVHDRNTLHWRKGFIRRLVNSFFLHRNMVFVKTVELKSSSDEVLGSIGFGAEELTRLRAANIIG